MESVDRGAAAVAGGLGPAAGDVDLSGTGWQLLAGLAAAGVWLLAAAAWAWMARRDQGHDSTAPWPWFSGALAVVGFGTLVESGARLARSTWVDLPDAAEPIWRVVATMLVYQGVVRWNRVRDGIAAPQDWINGLAAILAATAVVHLVGPWLGLASMSVVGVLESMEIAGSLVVLGAIAGVARLAGLARDPRFWVVAAMFCLVGAGEVVEHARAGLEWVPLLGWVIAAGGLSWSARRPEPRVHARHRASAGATALGAGAVLVSSIVVLAVHSESKALLVQLAELSFGEPAWPLAFAALATVVAAARLVVMLRDRALLAVSLREARTDELTTIGNRRAFLERLAQLSTRRSSVGLVLVDLDNFKEVNDRHGHGAGDDVLRAAALALRGIAPSGALVARVGGDEFAIIVDGDIHQTRAVAARAADAVPQRTSTVAAGRGRAVAASIGMAWGPADAEALLHDADVAMYTAKRNGEGIVVYDDVLGATLLERQLLADELHAVLTDGASGPGQFVVWYQPQVAAKTSMPTGVEALVRWHHPRHGLLGPNRFLDLVEDSGLMLRLTEHVLDTAVREVAVIVSDHGPLRLSVNLSASVLTDPAVVPLIERALKASGLRPSQLTVEITESALIPGDSLAFRHVTTLAELGLGLSIDDYGTGFSSLAQLHHVPATELKLDRDFTRDLILDPRARTIVRATIDLAHRLALRVVGEGVEDTATLAVLSSLGCDEIQGWVHAPAMPAAELSDWLVQRGDHRPDHAPSQRAHAYHAYER